MHFHPVSDFLPIWENFQTPWKILTILPFPQIFLSLAQNLITSPCFGKNFISPLLFAISPHFSFDLCVFPTLGPTCFSFSYVLSMIHLCIIQYTYWTPLGLPKYHLHGV